MKQCIQEIAGGNFSTSSETIRDVIRQTCLVNLWFLLKFVCAYSGPFDRINYDLHLDMCNFRQEFSVPGKGTNPQAACFIPRFHLKTTVNTKGGPIWGLLRNPNLRVQIFTNTADRTAEFVNTIRDVFTKNEMFQWLFPEYTITSKENFILLNNRTKLLTEPSVAGHGVECKTAGIHGDEVLIDDPAGDEQLDSSNMTGVVATRIRNWLVSNMRSLVVDWTTSRIFYSGTRYAEDDVHQFIFDDIKELRGYARYRELFPVKETGSWVVYMRDVKEEGNITFPEAITEEGLSKLDSWTYATQFSNNPKASGLNELSQYKTKSCRLEFNSKTGFYVEYFEHGDSIILPLSECDVLIAADPGTTEKVQNSRTSQTAIGVFVRSKEDKRFVVELVAEFLAPSKVFDILFRLSQRYRDYFRATFLETQGAFKVLEDLLITDQNRRNEILLIDEKEYNLRLQCSPKTGEKNVMIRNTLEPLLRGKLLYVDERIKARVDGELDKFPFGTKDVLDMIALAERSSRRPQTIRQEKKFKKAQRKYRQSLGAMVRFC